MGSHLDLGCKWLLVATLTLGCGTETEEVRLRKQVNVTSTHLYAALKLAVSSNPESDDAKRARQLLVELEENLRKQSPSDSTPARVDLTALTEVASVLWRLRAAGREEVEQWRDSRVSVLRPEMFNETAESERLAVEHGVLLLGLTALRLHPRAPAPVPAEAVLYEAYLFGDSPIANIDLEGMARSAQVIVYAREEYCELAAASTQRLTQIPLATSGSELRNVADLAVGLGRAAAHAPPAAALVAALILVDNLPWATRLLAFASSAQCLSESSLDARQRAIVEWERAVSVAEAVGFPPAELGFLRAYLAYQREDFPTVQRELAVARESRLLTSDERTQLDDLVSHFDAQDRTTLDRFIDPLFVSRWVARLVHHRLEAAGFYRALGEVPALRLVSGVFQASAIPDPAQARVAGNGGWEWLKARWQEWMTEP